LVGLKKAGSAGSTTTWVMTEATEGLSPLALSSLRRAWLIM